ncbi:Syntaxin-22 [Balamuthia mandrillaris]
MSFDDIERGRRAPAWGASYQAGGGGGDGFGGFGGVGTTGASNYTGLRAGGADPYTISNSSASGRSGEFERLSDAIFNNVKQINFNVTQITRMVDDIGSARDSQDLRHRLRDIIEATRKTALDTNAEFKDMARLPGINSGEYKRKQTKLKTDFQTSLEHFQKISKLASSKSSSTAPPKAPSFSPAQKGRPAPAFEYDEEDDQQSMIEAQRRQQILQLENDRDFQNALIEEREQGIREIESTIQEVNEIFIDLANLVNEQAPMIDNIESHIDSSVSSTSRGVVELRKAAAYQRSARTKLCFLILLILAIVVAVVVVLLLALKLK